MAVKRLHVLLIIAAALGVVATVPALRRKAVSTLLGARQWIVGRRTVADRLAQFEAPVRARLEPRLQQAGLAWPPARLTLIACKQEEFLEVWAAPTNGPVRLLKTYPILGASGQLGPKLAEGDRQVPEGIYPVESLHPNSAFHLALRVGYPNAFDRAKGAADGRPELGSDIMIHGSTASIGCLAMGDPAAEELFVLAARAGIANIRVLISPVDLRRRPAPGPGPNTPAWVPELYAERGQALQAFRHESPASKPHPPTPPTPRL